MNNKLVFVPPEGIPPRVGDIPGNAICDIVIWDSPEFEYIRTGERIKVYNWLSSNFKSSNVFKVVLVEYCQGTWWALKEPSHINDVIDDKEVEVLIRWK